MSKRFPTRFVRRFLTVEKQIRKEIMSTEVYIKIQDDTKTFTKEEVTKDIETALNLFREFEQKFSRFIPNNDLTKFNEAGGSIKISDPDFMSMLVMSQKYSDITNGLFDITILPYLINEGYEISSTQGFIKPDHKDLPTKNYTYKDLVIDMAGGTVYKPKDLKIDFGGIGKGFIVDKVGTMLADKYKNFLVYAGGDIYFRGSDLEHNYDYWGSSLENPKVARKGMLTFMFRNNCAATSSVKYRHWKKDSHRKTHIIDPRTKKSVTDNILSATVIAPSTMESDILAKSLIVMGVDQAVEFSKQNEISSVLVGKDLKLYISPKAIKYIWGLDK